MENREISKVLSETAKLMELHNENEFKVKTLQNASFQIGRLTMPLHSMNADEIELLKGIGKSTSKKVIEILHTGTLAELVQYLDNTPPGILELMRIKGIGPKKTSVIWKQLQIESPGELLYACNENRLVELKGFGLKTQEQIKKAIEFTLTHKGYFLYASLESFAQNILEQISALPAVLKVSFTGEFRRKCEVINALEFLIATDKIDQVKQEIAELKQFSEFIFTNTELGLHLSNESGLKILFYFTEASSFAIKLFVTTGSDSHLNELNFDREGSLINAGFKDEISIYNHFNLPYFEPELREGTGEINFVKTKSLPELILFEHLKGCLHNHSTYSDGLNSLKEMSIECKNAGYEYFGICDHSKSAFYANGMQLERIKSQHLEIDLLNVELAPFKIFKGVESDILNDGSLDYDFETLASFDFVVASVHSNLKMDITRATTRLLNAIENPFTTILGHPTGRLLLAREGYPINHKEIIDACARCGVVIELNANPFRLDLDWRWIQYAVECGVMISINPDAHALAGIHDMYYGVCAGRKGMLTREATFNALSCEEIGRWFHQKKAKALQSN